MKKYLTAALFSLISTAAFADGSPCEDTGRMIGNLEHKKKTGGISQPERGILASGYQTYYQSGCSESQLTTYFKNGEKPKSKEEIR